MQTIYKYQLPITDDFEIQLPINSEFLKIDIQHENVVMWVKLDKDSEMKFYQFHCYGTGHPIENKNLKYIDTIIIDNGNLVFHYFVEV